MKTTTLQMAKMLISNGFVIGKRNPKINSNFPGSYMVHEPLPDNITSTVDGRDVWAIVGYNLPGLINEAFLAHFLSLKEADMEYCHCITVKYIGWTNSKPVRFSVKSSYPSKKAIYSYHIIPDDYQGNDYEWMAEHFIKENKIPYRIDCALSAIDSKCEDSITFVLK